MLIANCLTEKGTSQEFIPGTLSIPLILFCFKETVMNVTEVSEAAITVRGPFFPSGKNQIVLFLLQ